MATEIRVLVSDFMPVYEQGLADTLNRVDGITATVATNVLSDLDQETARTGASVVIAGLADSVDEVADFVNRLNEALPSVYVMVAVDPDDGSRIGDLMGIGSINLLSRRASLAEVADTVRAVAAGRTIVPADIAPRMMDELSVAVRRAESRWLAGGLTRRELEVLSHVADGLPNRDVARLLHISENTVKNHMRNIHEKLGVKTRTEAVVKAAKDGLLGSRFARLGSFRSKGELSGSVSSATK
ncbi:MAG: response regulator transcription factor [Candidatus Nanopelagicales bacterium]